MTDPIAHNNRQLKEYAMSKNVIAEGLRQVAALKPWLDDPYKPKADKEEALRSLRELERKLGPEGENYNGRSK